MTSALSPWSISDVGSSSKRVKPIDRKACILPGLALCGLVALAALAIEVLERRLFGRAKLEALVLAIVIGPAVRTLGAPGARWHGGITFSAKTLLEVAAVLLVRASRSALWPKSGRPRCLGSRAWSRP